MSAILDNSAALSPDDDSIRGQWEPVYTAIEIRWPEIDQTELKSCGRSLRELTEFVQQRVDTSREEIEAVISEFAPQQQSRLHTFVDPITERVHQLSSGASDRVHSVIERAQYEIDEAPVRWSMSALLLGFGLGILATTLYVQSRPRPTAWQRMTSRRSGH